MEIIKTVLCCVYNNCEQHTIISIPVSSS